MRDTQADPELFGRVHCLASSFQMQTWFPEGGPPPPWLEVTLKLVPRTSHP